jgi:transcriptional regulator with XRE-family HTH domain
MTLKSVKAEQELQVLVNILTLRRVSLGIQQEDLGNAIGSNQSGISRLETRRYNPSILAVLEWADALGCELVLQEKPGWTVENLRSYPREI